MDTRVYCAVGGNTHTGMKRLTVIAGPCVVENRDTTMRIADTLLLICDRLEINLLFKASYRKANRSRMDAFTGIGDMTALEILSEVHDRFAADVITDIHEAEEAARAAMFVQALQIPAFLCRQTDLLIAAAKTDLPINIKKGQFMSAAAMENAVGKIRSVAGRPVIITERGNSFGYNDVVVDMRNISLLSGICDGVLVDVTHTNGGAYRHSFALAAASIAAGADGIFLETHPDPGKALSDGKNMIPLYEVEGLLTQLKQIKEVVG